MTTVDTESPGSTADGPSLIRVKWGIIAMCVFRAWGVSVRVVCPLRAAPERAAYTILKKTN